MKLRWLKRSRETWIQNNPGGQIPGPAPVWGIEHLEPVLQYMDDDGVWRDIPVIEEHEKC